MLIGWGDTSPEDGRAATRPGDDGPRSPVPLRALVLSIMALAVPVTATVFFPSWAGEDLGLLLWLTALVPAFLLTYHRGWWGTSLALASGMAALSVAQAVVVAFDLGTPNWTFLLGAVLAYLVICGGTAVFGEILRRERAAAAAMALIDPLTGMPNRRHADLFLDSAFAAAERGHPLTVVLFDLDDFKPYNDRHGHVAGDEVLRGIADLLLRFTRKMNLSARYGGEEFLSILGNCRAEGAEVFVGRVQDALRNTEFRGEGVTASAGIAEYEPGMGSAEVLVAAADRALYRAKEEGRDGYSIAPRRDPEERERLARRSTQVARDRRAPATAEADGAVARPPHGKTPRPEDGESPGGDRGGRYEDLPGGSETILLVEDDDAARRSLSGLLNRLGYRVLEAEAGEPALEAAHGMETSPDLLVTDLVMPGMSGFTLSERLLSELGELRVLYMSGYGHGEILWPGAPGTVRGFVSKPLEPAELAGAVRSVLDADPSAVGTSAGPGA